MHISIIQKKNDITKVSKSLAKYKSENNSVSFSN